LLPPADIVLQTQETTMFTKTFTRERHIEELRAELRGCLDVEEAEAIRAELEEILSNPDSIADDERLAS
jgi:hypothetical protein